MSVAEAIYRIVVRGVRSAAPFFARGGSKLARGLRGRRDAVELLVSWGEEWRRPRSPAVWFHAPSVGEGLQARSVIESLEREVPGIQLAFTHFSPSAVALARRMPVDVAGYLPWDLPDEMGAVLDALRPDLVAFTKTEVWPTLSREARRRGVPTALVAATLPRTAGRLRPLARPFLRPAFRRLERACAISEEDGERFTMLGVPTDRIVVTGDPGVDSAAFRAESADRHAPHLAAFADQDRPTLVAGSTWPSDEAVLLPAAGRVRERHPELRLVVAPHEPRDGHLRPLMAALLSEGWSARRLSQVEEAGSAEGADAVVVDRVGVLADLYSLGTLAWVGGGFHDEGLHSVLEPAAWGLGVLVGPRHENAREARRLLERGGAVEVDGVETAAAAIEAWLDEPGRAREAGARGRAYIDEHRGASDRTARLLAEILRGG